MMNTAICKIKRRRTPSLHIHEGFVDWLHENYAEIPEGYVTKESIYRHYCLFCKERDIIPKKRNIFGRMLKRALPNVRPCRLGTAGNITTCYAGITTKPQSSSARAPDSPHTHARPPVAPETETLAAASPQASVSCQNAGPPEGPLSFFPHSTQAPTPPCPSASLPAHDATPEGASAAVPETVTPAALIVARSPPGTLVPLCPSAPVAAPATGDSDSRASFASSCPPLPYSPLLVPPYCPFCRQKTYSFVPYLAADSRTSHGPFLYPRYHLESGWPPHLAAVPSFFPQQQEQDSNAPLVSSSASPQEQPDVSAPFLPDCYDESSDPTGCTLQGARSPHSERSSGNNCTATSDIAFHMCVSIKADETAASSTSADHLSALRFGVDTKASTTASASTSTTAFGALLGSFFANHSPLIVQTCENKNSCGDDSSDSFVDAVFRDDLADSEGHESRCYPVASDRGWHLGL